MKRVITYGTFDLLHYGHINLLKRAKALGDYLIVALSTDEFNWNSKQKKCLPNSLFAVYINACTAVCGLGQVSLERLIKILE